MSDIPSILMPNGTKLAAIEAMENNWYEGSRWSANRSWVWFPLQDAKRDLDRYTRYELNKHSRYLYKNSPFMRGLIERIVILVIGSGFKPVFKSASRPDWAHRAQARWRKRSRNVNLGYKASFGQYQRAIARARFTDGECFSIKTFDELVMENRVQAVEGDRCVGNNSGSESKETNTVDGVNVNSQDIPISYSFRGVKTPYDAEHIIHHYTPLRPQQYRGETILAAAINTARDVDDILALEKECVKDASSKKDVIKTTTGSLDPDQFRSVRYNGASPGGNFPTLFSLPVDTRAKDDYYRVHLGAQSVVLKTGDEYTPYTPARPGAAWQGFMDFLSNTICLSTGMPPSVVLPVNIGGTDIRRDLDIAQRVVEPWQEDICAELEEIVLYVMEGDLIDGDLSDQPSDWHIAWHFPPKLNVDRQQAQQDRADAQAGLMSWEEYHGRYGEDGDTYEQSVINEVARRRDRIVSAKFKDVDEFVKVLSLDPRLFMSKPGGEQEPKPKE